MLRTMRIGTLIKALGGPTAVSTALGLRLSAVGNWTGRDAIPREHHLAVWRLATAKKVPWTPPDAAGLVLAPAAVETSPAPANDSPKSKAAKRPTRSAGAAANSTSSAKAA